MPSRVPDPKGFTVSCRDGWCANPGADWWDAVRYEARCKKH